MGNFYANYTLWGPSQQDVADSLTGRKAIVTPIKNGCVVVFDEESDSQNTDVIGELAARLSETFQCPVLATMIHDDDILWYQLYENGEMVDEYNSSPNYFSISEISSVPFGGDAKKLSSLFNATDSNKVEKVLRAPPHAEKYVFESERHADLVEALGISPYAVATAYASFDNDEYPEGLTSEDIIRCE